MMSRGHRLLLLLLMLGTLPTVQAALRGGSAPTRIVSTSPGITETLFALGLGDRVVGVSTFCQFPPAVSAIPKVGTFLKPQPEIIARLRPDLVLVHANPNTAVAQLNALGIRTVVIGRGRLPEVFATIRQISQAAAVPAAGERLAKEINASLERVRLAVVGRAPRKVLIIVSRRPGTLTDLVAVGPGSYLHDLLVVAGGTNVLSSSPLEYPRISLETVIKLEPDVIVDIDTGGMGGPPSSLQGRQQLVEELWRRQPGVKAVSTGGHHPTFDQAFSVPGPRVVDAVKLLARWLHNIDLD